VYSPKRAAARFGEYTSTSRKRRAVTPSEASFVPE